MGKQWTIGLGAVLLASCASVPAQMGADGNPAQSTALVRATTPPSRDQKDLQVLFWSDAERAARFRDMESWFPGLEVAPSARPRTLATGAPLPAEAAAALRDAMARTNAAGVMVLEDGKVRFEEYALGFGPSQRWTSFSVAKSFTSTLLGAALRDGKIASTQDKVTKYIPGLVGSAYDDVTVAQLATMTSGVRWNEDYTDPNSDVAQLGRYVLEHGKDAIVAQMKTLPREAPPGEKWVYKTGETNLIGVLVENAVGMSLAAYAKDKIVDPAGFEGGLFWMTDPRGGNVGGCCLSLRLSDYARFGQFVLEGGGTVVSPGWFADATQAQVNLGQGYGYGYQWWTYPGSYGAQGIFGQAITIVPSRKLVMAVVSNWPTATSQANRGVFAKALGVVAEGE